MSTLAAGSQFPKLEVPTLGGDTVTLGLPAGGHDWQLVVVYRGLHCPICKNYLSKLQEMEPTFNDLGVDVIAVSGDGRDKAQAMATEKELNLRIGYDLSLDQMAQLGLYISDPRSPQETDQPFPEPGLFVVNAEGAIQILDISNAPFARPDLEMIANGIKFVRANDYPIRGMHAA
ncbi:AhpC/TSA family protein [Sulfitobacter albidus]|uniref:AhpC/TSA family protein n=1 Tax=Sulfitobacter albidus TaxID=2829501 RepID=A0A975JAY4_9RHOB|nr:peroxiredoxin-like family protein [Sulfitobacter albidus]QUJ75118.1 AhpC/TSA family protein [Sulfitobacter albidus]